MCEELNVTVKHLTKQYVGNMKCKNFKFEDIVMK